MSIRTTLLAACAVSGVVLAAMPASATVTVYTVSGAFVGGGGNLSGTFTVDDSLYSVGNEKNAITALNLAISGVDLTGLSVSYYNYFAASQTNNIQLSFGPSSAVFPGILSLNATGDQFFHGTLASNALSAIYALPGSPIPRSMSSGTITAPAATTPSVPDAAPEPSTWALMLAGFGLTGAALRRRAPAVAA